MTVEAPPAEAFAAFTREIAAWWRKESSYWYDRSQRLYLRLEPRLGGRLVEVYDDETGHGLEVGRVVEWQPPKRLALQWLAWLRPGRSHVVVTFARAEDGTHVRVEQDGFEPYSEAAPQAAAEYAAGWTELLGWFADHVAVHRNLGPRKEE